MRLIYIPSRSLWSLFRTRTPALPSVPKYVETTEILQNGIKRVDGFRWMANVKEQTHLQTFIDQENVYAQSILAQHRPLREKLLKDMQRVLKVEHVATPLADIVGQYEYFTQTSPQGNVYYRRKLNSNLTEYIAGPDELPMGTSFKKILMSPNHELVAYIAETHGEEHGSLYIKHLSLRTVVELGRVTGVCNFEWANDNRTIVYTKCNDQLCPDKVYRHTINTEPIDDICIFHAQDNSFIDVGKTKDKAYITINSNTLESSEVHVIDSYHPNRPIRCIQPRILGLEYYIDHHEKQFFILTNANNAVDFKLMVTSDTETEMKNWKDLIVLPSGTKIEDIEIFKNYAAVYVKKNGTSALLVHNYATGQTHLVKLPVTVCSINPGINLDYDTVNVRFSLSHPYAFDSVFDYNMSTQQLKQQTTQPISHRAFDRSQFDLIQTFVTSQDDVHIPVTLLHRKGLSLNGSHPVSMRAYGAYGVSMDHYLRLDTLPLLKRDWVVCIAHVRGGSELGRQWYYEGKLQRKKNTFNDFINVAEYLIKEGFTRQDLLTATGLSAGGLCVAASAMMRPDLFRALVLKVPFVDVLSSMLDASLPLTTTEYLEWGNATASADVYHYISSYSPYDLLLKHYYTTLIQQLPLENKAVKLPSLYAVTGLRDQRVPYWQVTKFVAMYRLLMQVQSPSRASQDTRIIFRCEENMGHFGDDMGQQSELEGFADELTFLISETQSAV